MAHAIEDSPIAGNRPTGIEVFDRASSTFGEIEIQPSRVRASPISWLLG